MYNHNANIKTFYMCLSNTFGNFYTLAVNHYPAVYIYIIYIHDCDQKWKDARGIQTTYAVTTDV